MPVLLFSVTDTEFDKFARPVEAACRALGLEVEITRSWDRLEDIEFIVLSPDGPITDFTPFSRLKAALSLWAGVERIVKNETLRAPLCRMVDAGLTEGMVEYVTGHVLRYHLDLDQVLTGQDGTWRPEWVPPLAGSRTVAILGLGALGRACAEALVRLNFRVLGWTRRPKEIDGVECANGATGFFETLSRAEIVVTLLPATDDTCNIIAQDALKAMPRGARLINPGRGSLIDDEALLSALEDGHLDHATLDVFRREPLPPDHPFWAHPRITVTPHIAAATRPETAAKTIAENIRRAESGAPLLHLVDRASGY
ncbi:MAG: glyoxylate/hydroxypyruvate reductase A [Pseudomonadota bacterium]